MEKGEEGSGLCIWMLDSQAFVNFSDRGGSQKMGSPSNIFFANIFAYWRTIHLPEVLTLLFSLAMMFATIGSLRCFASFIESKPAGRKTVMGN